MTFGLVQFIAHTGIEFQNRLADCAIHGTQQGCEIANSNEDTSCIWSETNSSCYFADGFDCSPYSDDPIRCNTDPIISQYCFYRYVSSNSNSSSSSQGQCRHLAGWDDVQTGLFSSLSVVGGMFGPFLLQQLANRKGYPAAMIGISCLALLSAILFTIGVEKGQSLTLFVIARVFASIAGYASSYLLSAILSVCHYLEIDHEEKAFHTRLMGMSISVIAVVESIYLYFDTPKMKPRPVDQQYYGYTEYYPDFVDFKMRLHSYNMTEYFVAVGFLLFGLRLFWLEATGNKVSRCCGR